MNLFLGLFLSFITFQSGIDHQIVNQTSLYLENISAGKYEAESYWALNQVYSSTCANNSLVIRTIINSDVNETKDYFIDSGCTGFSINDETQYKFNRLQRTKKIALGEGLYGIAVAALLNESSPEKKAFFLEEYLAAWGTSLSSKEKNFLHALKDQSAIIVENLPDKDQELVFNLIFLANKLSTVFKEASYEKILESWIVIINTWEQGSTNDLLYSLALTNIYSLAFEINAFNVSADLFDDFINLSNYPTSIEKLRVYYAASYSLIYIGRFDLSLQILRNITLPLSVYVGDEEREDGTTFNIGYNLYSLGKYKEAKAIFQELYSDSGSYVNKTQVFANLSLAHLRLGEKNKYVELQLDALESAREDTLYKNELIILRNLFITYTKNRDEENALYYLNLAENIAKREKDIYELASIHAFSAFYQWEINKNAQESLREINIAKEQYYQIADYYDLISVLNDEARILTAIDSLDGAYRIYSDIRNIALEKSNSPDYVEALVGLTEILLRQDKLNEASKLLDEIRIYPLTDLEFSVSVKYNTVKAWYLKEIGETRKAYNNFKLIIDQITERARNSIDSQTGTWTIEEEYIQAYNLVANMLIELGNYPQAIQLLDELKTINDAALYNSPILRAQRLTEEELAEDRLLSEEIQTLRNQYLNASSSARRFEIDREIDRLSAQREMILNSVRSKMEFGDVSVWQAQRKLEKDEMILHYTEVGEELYISYITKDNSGIRKMSFDSDIKQLFIEAANKLASSETDLNLLYEVYKKLDLKGHIPANIQKLIVIPDNHLYRIPLGVLPVQVPASSFSYGNTRYLIEEYAIKYFTSLNEFLNNNRYQNDQVPVDFSAFALSDFSSFESTDLPSLPFTTKEVRDIDSRLQGFTNRSIYLENEATKDSFLTEIQQSRVVHVATHSEVSEEDPLFSTIYLKSQDDQQSALYAYELFDKQINSDLIMLNSCSSGSGGYLQGSGVVGISRALRYAGAKSLALNIWAVNDKSASEFATSFYTHIDDGAPKWLALQQAKLQLLETGNANPYYWGAYMLIGNPSPLTKKPANAGFLYSFLSVLILISAYLARNMRSEYT